MPESPRPAAAPQPTRLADYRAPDFLIDSVELVVELVGEDATRVTSRLAMRRNPAAAGRTAPLRLDGEALELVALALDGEALGANRYAVEPAALVIPDLPEAFSLDIETRIRPQDNTELSGLYVSGGNFCTQCEPEGFRRITYFLDRPDVMARYSTTILADRERYPVLLSNGNPVDRGESPGGRHWAKWDDPHPKPSYLFALVGGDLVATRDRFTTASGRPVDLAIWVRRGDEDKCDHAMASLKAAMRWDEEVFGLEYDLEVFNIVAVGDFNMGAMENKGLNIFNTKYVLAKPATATDADYLGIERVVAHEYFHNWTGDRVTCRDWFQLSLKEGLTVFRDQEFMSDRHSRAVKRIGDVRTLRARQFREDAGPLAHPVRPESYIEIDNFYTATVYEKGAEVVRMIHRLIGAAAFRRGMDLYFRRHDNQAVTVEDFVAAMAEASGMALGPFQRWYRQAGTPEISVEERYDPAARRYELTLGQATAPTPGEAEKQPLVVPVAMALLGHDGRALAARLEGDAAASAETRLLILDAERRRFRFEEVAEAPVPSLLRGFSAPVRLKDLPFQQLKFLAAYDGDPFVRWDAGQQVASRILIELAAAWRSGETLRLDPVIVEAQRRLLAGAAADPAFAAEALALPGEAALADQMAVVDVEAIHAARRFACAALGGALAGELAAAYAGFAADGPYCAEARAMGCRSLRNICLFYLAAPGTPAGMARALAQFEEGRNMTDVLAALAVLNDFDGPERKAALERFHAQWQSEDLVVDKWLALQATSALPGTLGRVEALIGHAAFDRRNPNRVRALIGGFAEGNQRRFHEASGEGYRFLADQVLALDPLNAQIASRLVQPLGTWRRHEPGRQALMRGQLERILAAPGLSKNCYEMAAKSLGVAG